MLRKRSDLGRLALAAALLVPILPASAQTTSRPLRRPVYAPSTVLRASYGHGTIFQLKPPSWSESVLHSFSWRDGNFPTSGPIFGLGGALYGTTLNGAYRRGVCKIAGGCGVVYQIMP